MSAYSTDQGRVNTPPSVVVVSLASCFGCQVQITNIETHLLDVLGQINLKYWQLTHDVEMPESFDIAIVEGAVTTQEAINTVKEVREKAQVLITVGACANTGGLPGLAAQDFSGRAKKVYEKTPSACGKMVSPQSVRDIVDADYRVNGCPIDPLKFVEVVQAALYGSNKYPLTQSMCGECRRNEAECFFSQGTMCLGLVTRGGCGALCVQHNRPCMGCRGLSPEANLNSARGVAQKAGISLEAFDCALKLFNQTDPAFKA